MTYTKKRIIIEAEVPEGATHYEVLINFRSDSCIEWYKKGDKHDYLWDWRYGEWGRIDCVIDRETNQIEVIE